MGVLKEATVDSLLLAALEQFKDEAMDRLLLSALEEHEESGTTQKAKKTPARRFATPKCDEDVAKAKIASVPKKTQTDTRYCHQIWEEWRDSRNSSAASREVVPDDITQMDNTSVQHWMSRFVLEVRKRDSTEYPPILFITSSVACSSTLEEAVLKYTSLRIGPLVVSEQFWTLE